MDTHAMASIGTLGTWLRHAGILSLPTALAKSVTHAVQDALSHPITIRMVFLGQNPDFHLKGNEINAFLQSLSEYGDCEWTCDHYSAPAQQEGISRSAISVLLKHRTRRENFPLKSVVIRELCSGLAGLHHFSGQRFRVVPEWQLSEVSDTNRIFGGYLILMQLGDFYDHSTESDLTDEEKKDWAEQILWLLGQFFQQFRELLTFLSDEDNEAVFSMMKTTPDTRQLVGLLRRLVEAVHSKQNLQEIESEFSRVPTQYLVKLMACSMEPLDKCGQELREATENIDDPYHPETEELMKALLRVIGSNTIFSGAVGVLSHDITAERETKKSWTMAGGVVAALASTVFMPLAIYSTLITASSGYEWYRKSCEYDQLQEMGKFNNDAGIAGTACKLYILLVASKAGSFFDHDTPQHMSYQQLLRKVMDMDVEYPDIQVNDFVKEQSTLICDKIDANWEMVFKIAEDYNVRVLNSERKQKQQYQIACEQMAFEQTPSEETESEIQPPVKLAELAEETPVLLS